MNSKGESSSLKQDDTFEDDEIFEDSTFLANFDHIFLKDKSIENNANVSLNRSALNVSALCCDEEISGYDKLTGKTWIYPTNYPVRDYQFNIIKAAILKNTLVSLPTGLGKTFIAAVIMYNFYRWYPLGKIVFTAPTRPLVAQQIDACYNIIAIPPDDTIEMTGHMQVATRKNHWHTKRVFFATPQVIYNDLKSGICPAVKIRCLVIDEAHRARGNYAYCQIVGTLDDMRHKTYRMLALSATPGSKVDDVINVVKSLHIAHLELRTENCKDVAPYSHSRKIDTVIVQLGQELTQLRQQYVEILDGYARRLKQFNILPHNLGNLSKGRIVMLYKEYQSKDRGARHPQHNFIMKDFTLLISLYHGLELLVKHGSRVFLNFFDEHTEKGWIQSDVRLTGLLERLRDDLGVNPLSLDRSILPDGTIPEMPKDLCFGHPKFDKLKTIIMEHFTAAKQKQQDTRAIIFCEYRESVNLVHCLLLQCRPLIIPQMFVGQGASGKEGKALVSQKQQLRVMRNFREGVCNTLVATCVAEEGLDVGSVDLILCFDISTRSPIRLVQRCGRTGRERGGQVYILVTEGREHQTLMDCMRQRDGLNKKILQSREVQKNLYENNPRMMPHDFVPECQKMYITVAKKDTKETVEKNAKKGQKDLRSMLLSKPSTSRLSSSSKDVSKNLVTEQEFKNLFPDGYREPKPLRRPVSCWAMNLETFKAYAMKEDNSQDLNLSKWLEWQRTLQKTANVGHSKDSVFLATFLQKCDTLRLQPTQNIVHTEPLAIKSQELPLHNIPTSMQSPIKTKPTKKKQKVQITKSPAKNNGDIRALFSTATKSTKCYTKVINDLGIQNDGSVPTRLINILIDLNINHGNNRNKCYVCLNICDCQVLKSRKQVDSKQIVLSNLLKKPVLPDLELINDMKADTILNYRKEVQGTIDADVKSITSIANDHANRSNNFDLEFDFDAMDDITSPEVKPNEIITPCDKQFDLGDIDDIFEDSSPEEAVNNAIDSKNNTEDVEKAEPKKAKDALGFFGLESIDDIFADFEDNDDEILNVPISVPNEPNNSFPASKDSNISVDKYFAQDVHASRLNLAKENKKSNNIVIEADNNKNVPDYENPTSPSILSGRQRITKLPSSPILCSQARKFSLTTKKSKAQTSTPNTSNKTKLTITELENNNVVIIDDDKGQKTTFNSIVDTSNKSMLTITQLVDMINRTDKSVIADNSNTNFNKKRCIQKHKERSTSPILVTQTDLNANNKTRVPVNIERCTSPILLTQSDRKRSLNSNLSKNTYIRSQRNVNESLIILDSESDSDDTQIYDLGDEISKLNTIINMNNNDSPIGVKRKFKETNDPVTASSYFNKKPKLDNVSEKPMSIQEKVLAALSAANKPNFINNQTNYNCTVSQHNAFSEKSDRSPLKLTILNDNEVRKSSLEMLQSFRNDNKLEISSNKFDSIFKVSPKKIYSPIKNVFEYSLDFIHLSPKCDRSRRSDKENMPVKRKIFHSDSDDDFVSDKNNSSSPKTIAGMKPRIGSTTNHKVRKKKRKANSFIEMEACLSDDCEDSGDELSDDSIGSVADFICDDTQAHDVTAHHVDMHAVYLKSVRSPVKKNGFKIPELPNKFKCSEVFSQLIEEDNYEMDSFCVDSHVGLTQINDVSELELAEIVLEEEKRAKRRRAKKQSPSIQDNCFSPEKNGESPLIRRKKQNVKRQIHSDSDDSS